MRNLLFSFIFSLIAVGANGAVEYQTGDLIFHMSQGRQAAAITEAQGSPYSHMGVLVKESNSWLVYEAIQPVKKTPLASFIARGKNKHFVVKRINPSVFDMSSTLAQNALIREMSQFLDYNYDIFFQWSDDTIYCSELAYKAYFRALGIQPGVLQKVGDLDLTGPNIRKLIAERERQLGHPADLNEPIITPVAIMNSAILTEVR
ncbi:MAG: hypothetical protein KDD38_10235 [Bdellovibrionales bacterium]|nr:hypothetical protein [Bdellovibrionales bacterium]